MSRPRKRAARTQGVRPAEPLTPDAIVATTMRLIDERGVDFSMRSLAAELGVFPSAIYWHVGSRNELLALVSSAWMRDAMPELHDDDWIEWLRQNGYGYRRAAHRHPNIARLISSELVTDPAAFDLPEAIVSRLVAGGIPEDELVHAYNTMVAVTVGFVDLELALDPASGDEQRRSIRDRVMSLDPDRYPTLSRRVDRFADRAFSFRWTGGVEAPLDDSFAYMVELIIAGLLTRIRND